MRIWRRKSSIISEVLLDDCVNLVDDIPLDLWGLGPSKKLKLEQILPLKTQQAPALKEFATAYRKILKEIYSGEERLIQVRDLRPNEKWEGDEIPEILSIHEETLSKEFDSFSKSFEAIIGDVIEAADDRTGFLPFPKLNLVGRVICWLRCASVIQNPPKTKLDTLENFAAQGRSTAHSYLSRHISAKIAASAKRLLSSRPWDDNLPEQKLWEGNSSQYHNLHRRPRGAKTTQWNTFTITQGNNNEVEFIWDQFVK